MTFNNPLGSHKANQIIRLLTLGQECRALDVGCGTAEFLLRCVEHHQLKGVGVDLDQSAINVAREEAAERGLSSRCEFHLDNIERFPAEPGQFDLGICIGSTHAFGMGEAAYPGAIAAFREWVRPGGYVILGEGYWKQEPAAEYLKLIGDPTGIYRDHAGNISFAEEQGLIALHAAVSSYDDWDDFEWAHHRKIQSAAAANPDDERLRRARVNRSRQWLDGYLRWGRATMGFGVYVFQVPGTAISSTLRN